MSDDTKNPPESTGLKIPIAAQVGIGLAFVFLIYIIAVSATSFLSVWEEEDSSFYETAIQSLRMRSLNPAAPTAIIFWNYKNEESLSSARAFGSLPASLRIYGIHSGDAKEIEIRKAWLRVAPRTAPLIIDKTEILKTSFRVRSVPMAFVILPKNKKIYSFWGEASSASREQLLELIASE